MTVSTVFPSLCSTGKHRPISDRTPPALAGWTTDITIFNAVAERLPSPRPIVIYFHGGSFTLFTAASRTNDALNRRPVRQPPSRPPEHRFRRHV
jgi:acetyl esterase/lipase